MDVRLPTKRGLTKKSHATVLLFLLIMLVVIAIQGTYLGYVVGILTNLEKRFEISSRKSGTLLSVYDVGHTAAVVLVGILGAGRNHPRITAFGVLLSSLSMFILALPVIIFGTVSYDEVSLTNRRRHYIRESRCDPDRRDIGDFFEHCQRERNEQVAAYAILSVAQFLAGVAAAPFNTIAYVYIDDNLPNKHTSPFYLGLLSSMYAFGPALGFALSAGLTRVHTTIFNAPPNLDINSEEWVGAWWLGFIICGLLYLFCAVPLFFFPKSLLHPEKDAKNVEMQRLRQDYQLTHHDREIDAVARENEELSAVQQMKEAISNFPQMAWDLIRNPVFSSMVVGWMFGSYLVGGYSNYLPKYIETQYARSASVADIFAGAISIGSVAASTALGGYILTRFDLSPRKAILCLMASWSIIFASYLLGLTVGCDEPTMNELVATVDGAFEFRHTSDCNRGCRCVAIHHFDGVNFEGRNFFSPCHAGCVSFNREINKWDHCSCALDGPVENGLYMEECNQVYGYMAIMFVGLFFGNLFFMTTLMVVLRSVYDYQKVMALSFASCATNILGFIPAPIIFGWIIDSTCILWHSRCPRDRGNCVIYDNRSFRQSFHLSNAAFQLFAVIATAVCYFVTRRRQLPEEEEEGEDDRDVNASSDDIPQRSIALPTHQTDL